MRGTSTNSPSGSMGATALEAARAGERATARRWQPASLGRGRWLGRWPCAPTARGWALTPEFAPHPAATAPASGLLPLPRPLCLLERPLGPRGPRTTQVKALEERATAVSKIFPSGACRVPGLPVCEHVCMCTSVCRCVCTCTVHPYLFPALVSGGALKTPLLCTPMNSAPSGSCGKAAARGGPPSTSTCPALSWAQTPQGGGGSCVRGCVSLLGGTAAVSVLWHFICGLGKAALHLLMAPQNEHTAVVRGEEPRGEGNHGTAHGHGVATPQATSNTASWPAAGRAAMGTPSAGRKSLLAATPAREGVRGNTQGHQGCRVGGGLSGPAGSGAVCDSGAEGPGSAPQGVRQAPGSSGNARSGPAVPGKSRDEETP